MVTWQENTSLISLYWPSSIGKILQPHHGTKSDFVGTLQLFPQHHRRHVLLHSSSTLALEHASNLLSLICSHQCIPQCQLLIRNCAQWNTYPPTWSPGDRTVFGSTKQTELWQSSRHRHTWVHNPWKVGKEAIQAHAQNTYHQHCFWCHWLNF